MPSECAFCDIAQGRESVHEVWGDEATVGFLDRRPLFHGHVLLIPRRHAATLSDVPPEAVGPLFHVVQRLAIAVERAMNAQGTFIAVNNRVSQSIPHLHVHIVPRTKGDGLKGFFWPRRPYESPEQMRGAQAAIRRCLEEDAAAPSPRRLPGGPTSP